MSLPKARIDQVRTVILQTCFPNVYGNGAKFPHLKSSSICRIDIQKQSQMIIEAKLPPMTFEKGDFVFGHCEGELPWPAKITKLYESEYRVQFIGHRSFAVLTEESLVIFDEGSIGLVTDQYLMKKEKDVNKIKKAIGLCKTEIEKARKQKEKDLNKPKGQMRNKRNSQEVAERQPEEEERDVEICNQSKRVKKDLKKEKKSKVKKQESPKIEIAAQNQPKETVEAQIPQVPLELPANLLEKVEEPLIPSSNSNEPEEKQPEKIVPSIIQEVESTQKLEIVVAMVPPENNSQHSHIQQCSEQSTSMSVHRDENSVYSTEVLDIESISINKICSSLAKMVDYLTGKSPLPLTKQEKLELGIELKNHRRLTYEPVLLEQMVNFVKAFNFKLKPERKNCIIEYIKIKERLETCCQLRSLLPFNETTNEILNRYLDKTQVPQ